MYQKRFIFKSHLLFSNLTFYDPLKTKLDFHRNNPKPKGQTTTGLGCCRCRGVLCSLARQTNSLSISAVQDPVQLVQTHLLKFQGCYSRTSLFPLFFVWDKGNSSMVCWKRASLHDLIESYLEEFIFVFQPPGNLRTACWCFLMRAMEKLRFGSAACMPCPNHHPFSRDYCHPRCGLPDLTSDSLQPIFHQQLEPSGFSSHLEKIPSSWPRPVRLSMTWPS